MTDDDALDSMETEDTDEEIFIPRLKGDRILRSQTIANQDLNHGLSVRRSTRNRSQTYDNLNTSWIFGTQTLKGYPMYNQHNASSSDKDIGDEASRQTIRRRVTMRSQKKHLPNKSASRHLHNRSNHISSRVRSVQLRMQSEMRSCELGKIPKRDLRDLRDRSDRERELHECTDRERKLRNRNRSQIRQTTKCGLQDRTDIDRTNRNSRGIVLGSNLDIELRVFKGKKLRDRMEGGHRDIKIGTEDKSDIKPVIEEVGEEEQLRSKKLHSLRRGKRGPVTRMSNNCIKKDEELKHEQNQQDVDDVDDQSNESEKAENNNSDNEGYADMYTRVKRTRRTSQRQLQKRQIADSDVSDSSDTPGPRKYSLRQKKPTVERFQVNVEPVRRSMRAFRSVLSNSMRRHKLRNNSSSSSASSDSEHKRYDEKKNKKSRQSSIPQGGSTDRKADITPISVDINITFNDIGGLESHIHCLKEMVVFPMIYPDIFDQFHITPPKGVLFYGPPGTGKTLIARALANECIQGNRRVSFFMRKGADCLTKWVGESERQLRLLFEQAQQMKPSIIFFDEIDGLAPVRSTKQDQIHASIVSTLLALMDGLNDRGEVIIIGATNRIDAIDPALRRPGRFDRELFFPLPAMKERLEILKIHVKKWRNPPEEHVLRILADKATGYCGSDLKALCTEAVIQGLKRTYPQIYLTNHRLLLNPERIDVKRKDFAQASSLLVPSSYRVIPCVGKKLPIFMEPLLRPSFQKLLGMVEKIFPQGTDLDLAKLKIIKGIHRPRILITGCNMTLSQGALLAQAIIYHMEHLPVHSLNVSALFAVSGRTPEETCVQVFNEAIRNVPSIIYVAAIDQWWPLVPETVKSVFLHQLASLDISIPILILATSENMYDELPGQLQNLFSIIRGEIHPIDIPTEDQRSKFFEPIFTVQSLQPPKIRRKNIVMLEELPLAPDPEPKPLTEREKQNVYEKEEVSLRELRIFLREICAKLARNRQFFMFTKPVDIGEVPDYNEIIAKPMDLETMMTKIDMHYYLCARDFLEDIDLICRNALEYNPDRNPADKLIRHRACSLRDNAYALVKAELDSDFEEKCRTISANRRLPKSSIDKNQQSSKSDLTQPRVEIDERKKRTGCAMVLNGRKFSSSRKRRRVWARGYAKKVHKKKKMSLDNDVNIARNRNEILMMHASKAPAPSINLDKFQEFESEANSVLNGHLPISIPTDLSSNSHNDSTDDLQLQINPTVDFEQRLNEKKKKNSQVGTIEILSREIGKKKTHESRVESSSQTSVKRDCLDSDNLSLAFDSDSSQIDTPEEEDRVLIDRAELERTFAYAVKATDDLSIELLCDVYMQLSRCIDQYKYMWDRKLLPKDLFEEVKRFEKYKVVRKKDSSISILQTLQISSRP